MQRILTLVFAIILVGPSLAVAQEAKEAEARAIAQLKAELYYTRARHPAFEPYLKPTFRYLAVYPDLLVEAAYCAVSQKVSDECQEALNTIPAEARPAIPKGAIPVFTEQAKDTYIPLLDIETGLPIFESGNKKYTAFGPVGRKAPQHKSSVPKAGGIQPMGPIKQDAYGPGLHSDGTGRSFTYRTRDGQQTHGPVQQDGYGLGVHMDQYGRPVYAVPK